MRLEEQVVSLDLAKRLKELGVPQNAFFMWRKCSGNGRGMDYVWMVTPHRDVPRDAYSAFTVAELGVILPDECRSWHFMGRWIADDNGAFYTLKEINLEASTEADARAQLLIYLIEKKLISLNKETTQS